MSDTKSHDSTEKSTDETLNTSETSDHSTVKCEAGELPPAVRASKTPIIEPCGFEAADETVKNELPSLQPSARGVITIRLPFELTVEVTANEDVRVIGKHFQMLAMKNANQLGILHPNGRVFCDENEVHAAFSEVPFFTPKHSLTKTIGQKVESSRYISADQPDGLKFQAILRQNEIFFHSSMMSETVHMTGRKRPSKTVGVAFPEVKLDTLSKLIHGVEEKPTMKKLRQCEQMIGNGTFQMTNQKLQINLGSLMIRQNVRSAELEIFGDHGRHLHFVPQQLQLTVRAQQIEMGCRKTGIGHFKAGSRRIHTSRSGIVVSDAKTVALIDNFGQFICY
ncbi:hypothetical protein M3Y94_00712900 [Aphelenchoides besseyi]|nr:hypothetical protein M3Y94_00712900 [Aphelenchoides besseyi]KAI6231727.1 hypothetical protein M3Y95_00412300 [Aphelenchoides besseyi]